MTNDFAPLDDEERRRKKQELGFDARLPMVVVTGGGLGAKRINDAVARCLDQLLEITSVVLISGTAQYDELRALTPQNDPRFQLYGFIHKGMAELLGAADVVVARAGATTILELAALARPTILVPNRYLTGGHQLKNAAVYAENGAVELLDEHELEEQPQLLVDTLSSLLANPRRRSLMSKKFQAFTKKNAAKEVADLVLAAAKKK